MGGRGGRAWDPGVVVGLGWLGWCVVGVGGGCGQVRPEACLFVFIAYGMDLVFVAAPRPNPGEPAPRLVYLILEKAPRAHHGEQVHLPRRRRSQGDWNVPKGAGVLIYWPPRQQGTAGRNGPAPGLFISCPSLSHRGAASH